MRKTIWATLNGALSFFATGILIFSLTLSEILIKLYPSNIEVIRERPLFAALILAYLFYSLFLTRTLGLDWFPGKENRFF